jgi:hypothetical protein
VKETRTRSDGSKRRSYECANEHRFRTSETVAAIKNDKRYANLTKKEIQHETTSEHSERI